MDFVTPSSANAVQPVASSGWQVAQGRMLARILQTLRPRSRIGISKCARFWVHCDIAPYKRIDVLAGGMSAAFAGRVAVDQIAAIDVMLM